MSIPWPPGRRSGWLLGASAIALLACSDPEPDPVQREPDQSADAGARAAPLDASAPLDAGVQPDARIASPDGSEPADGGGPGHDGAVTPDPAAALYRPDQLLQVRLQVSPADWELLRHEGRTVNDIYAGCLDPAFEYTMVPAALDVDGQHFDRVGIRNRGLIGSIATRKPSLRIDLEEYVPGQKVHGEKTLTLVNSRQDTSLVRTCMAYAQYQAAGVEAPRCSFAAVEVNGASYGTYVHVEPVKKPFLKRRFGDDAGDLYESTGGDFRADRLAGLEKKTNEQAPRSPEIDQLTAALQKPDAELLDALAPLLDLDAFMRLWATEVLLGNDDSYSGNVNNYFVYVHPRTRKLSFLPWGPDGAFRRPLDPMRPKSVMAKGLLARRLYALESTRERYRDTLRELLATHWSEARLEAELERLAALLGTQSSTAGREEVRAFIRTRRAELEAELATTAPPWSYPEYPAVVCRPELNHPIRGRFEARWGEQGAPGISLGGANELEVDLGQGQLVQSLLPLIGNAAVDVFADKGGWSIGLVAVQWDGSIVTLQLISDTPRPVVGSVPFHGFETFGELLSGPSDALRSIGRVGRGRIVFEQAPLARGDLVRGTFEGEVVTLDHPF